MKLPFRNDRDIDEQAAAWLEILRKGGSAEREAFAAWAKESPRNVRAFLLMTALDVELDGVDANRRLETQLEATSVVSLDRRTQPSARTKNRRALQQPVRWAAALATIAIAAVMANAWLPTSYVTSVGEQRTFDLPDGSVVYLNTDSRIALDFSNAARDIRLTRGEALFKAARDNTRPFRVHTDDGVVEAIGTEFNVRRDAEGTKVSVIEGQVRVANQPTPLAAGQEATLQREARVVTRATADVARTLSWRQRRLVFRTDRLADIASEFNRYSRLPQVRVEGTALGERRFSGVFDADDPESFAQVLAGDPSVEVERTEREIVIKPR